MDSAPSRRAPGGLLVGGGPASDARGAGCSRTRIQRGTDVLQASAVLAGVMPAEQQLAAGAQQRPYLRSCAAAVAAIVAGEYGRHGRDPFRHAASSSARPDA